MAAGEGSGKRSETALERRQVLSLLGGGILAGLAGCGGDGGSNTASTPAPTPTTTESDPTATSTTSPPRRTTTTTTQPPTTTTEPTSTAPSETTIPAAEFDVVVAGDGNGDFTAVQPAIDSIDGDPDTETTVLIKPGTYYEKLEIPEETDNVTFVGRDRDATVLTYDDSAEQTGTTGSASFYAYGDRFTARNITFENSAEPVAQAVAALIDGDRSLFRNCNFLGNQDTLYVHGHGSRQYYKDCYVEGDVDFIFGGGTAVFDTCEIFCKVDGGYITAAHTPRDEQHGFVFKDCAITREDAPDNSYHLGRPWGPYAQTVFLRCSMADHIRPEGWDNWGDEDNEETAYYAEHDNSGPGYTPDKRVDWAHILTDSEANPYWLIFSDWDPMDKVDL